MALPLALDILKTVAAWETPTTLLGVGISGDNYDITIVASYGSLKLQGLAERAKKAKESSQF